MASFKVMLSCGDTLRTDAINRESAILQLKEKMDEAGIAEHTAMRHAGEQPMSVAEMHGMIERDTTEVTWP